MFGLPPDMPKPPDVTATQRRDAMKAPSATQMTAQQLTRFNTEKLDRAVGILRGQQNVYADEWNAAQQQRSAADSDLATQAQARRFGAFAVALSAGVTLVSAVFGFALGYGSGAALGWLLDLLT